MNESSGVKDMIKSTFLCPQERDAHQYYTDNKGITLQFFPSLAFKVLE